MRLEVARLNRVMSYLLKEMKQMDDNRDLPMKWSIMHMYSSTQIACLMAIKEGLNPELAGLIACMHDLGTIMTGKTDNHAGKAEPFVRKLIQKYNDDLRFDLSIIDDDEQNIILEAVLAHSDKKKITDKPYVELMKNVDSLDRYLHGVNTDEYHLERLNKCFDVFGIDY